MDSRKNYIDPRNAHKNRVVLDANSLLNNLSCTSSVSIEIVSSVAAP